MIPSSCTVYLNGEYLPLEEAHVPVMDRGFLFGDGVYEMIPVYGEHVFRLEQHLARLENSLQSIDIPNPYSPEEWRALIEALLTKNPGLDHRSIYIEVTRGAGDRNHIYEDGLIPTVFILCRDVPRKDFGNGVGAVTHEDIRWDYCDIKSVSLLPAVLLKQYANRADGAHEAILLKDGYVTEGASSNVFIVKNGKTTTPPKDRSLLWGITRDLIIELLREGNLPFEETPVTEAELRDADEIWITSSIMEIAPVIRLDGAQVGNGMPGRVWQNVDRLFKTFRSRMQASHTGEEPAT